MLQYVSISLAKKQAKQKQKQEQVHLQEVFRALKSLE